MKYKLSATIPTVQYGNLTPEIELECETLDEGAKIALTHITKLWGAYCEPGKELKPRHISVKNTPSKLKDNLKNKLIDMFGNVIYFDPIAHTYTNDKGEVYLSGSTYAKRFETPFNADFIADMMSKKSNGLVTVDQIKDAWRHKADVSAGFGTAIHAALEMREKFKQLSGLLDKPYDKHDHPVIKKIVDEFYELHPDENALAEVLVVDHNRKLAGFIDRLLVTDTKNKICIVTDFKTNAVIDKKKLAIYWQQLSFYASILEANGWTVEGLEIYHYDSEWHTYKSKVLKVTL